MDTQAFGAVCVGDSELLVNVALSVCDHNTDVHDTRAITAVAIEHIEGHHIDGSSRVGLGVGVSDAVHGGIKLSIRVVLVEEELHVDVPAVADGGHSHLIGADIKSSDDVLHEFQDKRPVVSFLLDGTARVDHESNVGNSCTGCKSKGK